MMKVGVVGRIASGEEQGRFVLVQDDADNTAGLLILTGTSRDFSVEGADAWVEDADALENYAQESNWIIEWEHP